MSHSNDNRTLRTIAWVLGVLAALALLAHLARRPRREEITVVFPSIVSLVRTTPDYVSLERTYSVEERETIEIRRLGVRLGEISMLRRYPVRVRAEIECDAFDGSFISYTETDSSCCVTLTLPRATLQPPVIINEGAYRPEPDADGLGPICIPAEERAEFIADYDALMERNAITEAIGLALEDGLLEEAEARAATGLTSAILALLRAGGFENWEVRVVFRDAPGGGPLPDHGPAAAERLISG